MTRKVLSFTLVILCSLLFITCKKDPVTPVVTNEEELITTINYTLTPTNGGTAVILTFKDLDGDGGEAPVITGGTLAANQTYTGKLALLNESETPAEDITEEIEEEDEEHQFFFQSSISDLTITYNDQDENGNPIGLNSTLNTGNAATGSITITLRHEPNKSAEGVSEGNINNAGGETDIEVTFPLNVE